MANASTESLRVDWMPVNWPGMIASYHEDPLDPEAGQRLPSLPARYVPESARLGWTATLLSSHNQRHWPERWLPFHSGLRCPDLWHSSSQRCALT